MVADCHGAREAGRQPRSRAAGDRRAVQDLRGGVEYRVAGTAPHRAARRIARPADARQTIRAAAGGVGRIGDRGADPGLPQRRQPDARPHRGADPRTVAAPRARREPWPHRVATDRRDTADRRDRRRARRDRREMGRAGVREHRGALAHRAGARGADGHARADVRAGAVNRDGAGVRLVAGAVGAPHRSRGGVERRGTRCHGQAARHAEAAGGGADRAVVRAARRRGPVRAHAGEPARSRLRLRQRAPADAPDRSDAEQPRHDRGCSPSTIN